MFASATHILKLELYKEHHHGPCARVTRTSMTHSIFCLLSKPKKKKLLKTFPEALPEERIHQHSSILNVYFLVLFHSIQVCHLKSKLNIVFKSWFELLKDTVWFPALPVAKPCDVGQVTSALGLGLLTAKREQWHLCYLVMGFRLRLHQGHPGRRWVGPTATSAQRGSLLLIVTRAPLGLMPASNVTKPRNTISKMLSKVRVHGKWSANGKGWLQLQITENTLTKLQVLKDSGGQEVQSGLLLGSTLPWASSFFRPEARWQQCL